MVDHGIICKRTCCAITNIFQYLSENRVKKLRERELAHFGKQNSFNNSRKDGQVGIDLVDPMLNTLQTLELADVSQLFTFT